MAPWRKDNSIFRLPDDFAVVRVWRRQARSGCTAAFAAALRAAGGRPSRRIRAAQVNRAVRIRLSGDLCDARRRRARRKACSGSLLLGAFLHFLSCVLCALRVKSSVTATAVGCHGTYSRRGRRARKEHHGVRVAARLPPSPSRFARQEVARDDEYERRRSTEPFVFVSRVTSVTPAAGGRGEGVEAAAFFLAPFRHCVRSSSPHAVHETRT